MMNVRLLAMTLSKEASMDTWCILPEEIDQMYAAFSVRCTPEETAKCMARWAEAKYRVRQRELLAACEKAYLIIDTYGTWAEEVEVDGEILNVVDVQEQLMAALQKAGRLG